MSTLMQDVLSPLPAGGASSAAYSGSTGSAARAPPQPLMPSLAAPVRPAVQQPTATAQPAPSRCSALNCVLPIEHILQPIFVGASSALPDLLTQPVSAS